MNTLELDDELNSMIIQGNSADALHRFYAEDVVAQENDEPERIGLLRNASGELWRAQHPCGPTVNASAITRILRGKRAW